MFQSNLNSSTLNANSNASQVKNGPHGNTITCIQVKKWYGKCCQEISTSGMDDVKIIIMGRIGWKGCCMENGRDFEENGTFVIVI